jgi:RNA polymerase sigma factor (sigma-70 family)
MKYTRPKPTDQAFHELSPKKQLLGYVFDSETMSNIWKDLCRWVPANEWDTRKSAIEDIIQDAWLSLWKGIVAGRITDVKYTLVKRAVRNSRVDRHRRKKDHHFVELEETHSFTDSDEDRIIAKHDVENLICRLNPDQGEIVRMFNIEELTQQEIASELNLSLKTVQREVKAANILMREMVH